MIAASLLQAASYKFGHNKTENSLIMLVALQLTARAKLCIEGRVVQNRCAAACKGEAAIANHCTDTKQ